MPGESVSIEGMDQTTLAELATMTTRLANNPKTRGMFLQLAKVDNPNLSIPEVELKHQVGTVLKAQHDKITELEGKLSKKFQEDDAMRAEAAALAENGFNEASKEDIRKFMLENRVADFGKGAKLYKMAQESATPTTSAAPREYGISMPADFKEIAANPSAWATKQASAAIAELQAKRRAA